MKITVPKLNDNVEGGPYIVHYKDSGSLLDDSEPINAAICFNSKIAAEAFAEKICDGKNASKEILPLRTI